MVVVVVDQAWEWFRSILGDMASAEPQQYLFSQCATQISIVVKCDLIVTCKGAVAAIDCIYLHVAVYLLYNLGTSYGRFPRSLQPP